MEGSKKTMGEKMVLTIQILILVFFYTFTAGVITFVSSVVYRSWVNNDAWIHAIIIATLVTFLFLILTFVVTMVFMVTVREGLK